MQKVRLNGINLNCYRTDCKANVEHLNCQSLLHHNIQVNFILEQENTTKELFDNGRQQGRADLA